MIPRLAITVGDVNGIGPEIVQKALGARRKRRFAAVVVAPDFLEPTFALQEPDAFVGVTTDLRAVEPGVIDATAGVASMLCVEKAVDLCVAGECDGMVTAPISKEAIQLGGFKYPGHTEFIGERTGGKNPLMLMVSEETKVALVTSHIPIHRVAETVSAEVIEAKILKLVACLRQDFAIETPSIAVLGLNPHAGDGGVLGREELDLIGPALNNVGGVVNVSGPFAADAFFARQSYREYDGVLAMYHDQGLIPFKMIASGRGVNVTAGLPIVRTSPDHGTAFDIAGLGKADPESLQVACTVAAQCVENRRVKR